MRFLVFFSCLPAQPHRQPSLRSWYQARRRCLREFGCCRNDLHIDRWLSVPTPDLAPTILLHATRAARVCTALTAPRARERPNTLCSPVSGLSNGTRGVIHVAQWREGEEPSRKESRCVRTPRILGNPCACDWGRSVPGVSRSYPLHGSCRPSRDIRAAAAACNPQVSVKCFVVSSVIRQL